VLGKAFSFSALYNTSTVFPPSLCVGEGPFFFCSLRSPSAVPAITGPIPLNPLLFPYHGYFSYSPSLFLFFCSTSIFPVIDPSSHRSDPFLFFSFSYSAINCFSYDRSIHPSLSVFFLFLLHEYRTRVKSRKRKSLP